MSPLHLYRALFYGFYQIADRVGSRGARPQTGAALIVPLLATINVITAIELLESLHLVTISDDHLRALGVGIALGSGGSNLWILLRQQRWKTIVDELDSTPLSSRRVMLWSAAAYTVTSLVALAIVSLLPNRPGG